MKTMTKVLTVAAALVVALSLAAPVAAICNTNSIITTIASDATSYIFNPAFKNHPSFAYSGYGNPTVYSYVAGDPAPTPLSPAAKVTFWNLGSGDPAPGVGNDNGIYDMVAGGGVYLYGYGVGGGYYPDFSFWYGATLFGSWDGGVTDNCVQANTCMCLLITDQDGDQGYFAILGGQANLNLDTFMNRKGTSDAGGGGNNAPIELVPISGPVITGSSRNMDGDLTVNVMAPSPGGDYSQDGCACAPQAYRILQATVPFGSPPPSDRDTGAWTEPVLADGVTPQGANAFGAPVSLNTDCTDPLTEVYLTTQLLFDSGFDASVVSTNSTRLECDPTLATPERPQDNRPDRPGLDRAPRGRRK